MHLKKTEDPLELFEAWYALAREREPEFPDAAALATVSEHGMPSVRMVLIKQADADGIGTCRKANPDPFGRGYSAVKVGAVDARDSEQFIMQRLRHRISPHFAPEDRWRFRHSRYATRSSGSIAWSADPYAVATRHRM